MRIKKYGMIFFWLSVSILLISLGINQYLNEKEKYKNYKKMDGIYEGKQIYSTGDNGNNYSLTYSYSVKNENYSVTTNYGTQSVPRKGTVRKIVYNIYDPSDAFVQSVSVSDTLFLFGFGSLAIFFFKLLAIFSENTKRKNIVDFLYGILFAYLFCSVSIYTYALITGTKNIFTIFDMFLSYGEVVLFPMFFFAVGVFLLIYYILPHKKEKKEEISDFEKEQEKLRKSERLETLNRVENTVEKLAKKSYFVGAFVQLIVSFFIFGILFYSVIGSSELMSVLLLIPFLVVAGTIFIKSILLVKNLFSRQELTEEIIKKREKIDSCLDKVYVIAFLSFWFGILLFVSVQCIIEGIWSMIFFTIPFWLVGGYIVKISFRSDKK